MKKKTIFFNSLQKSFNRCRSSDKRTHSIIADEFKKKSFQFIRVNSELQAAHS